MNRNKLLLPTMLLLLFYPFYMGMDAGLLLFDEEALVEVTNAIRAFQLSIWIVWVLLVGMAIYYKWTVKQNLYFYITYCFLLISFVLYGILTQKAVNLFNLPSGFKDNYSYGVFTALQQFAPAVFLTAFLQFSVWIFRKKWHRN